MKMTKVQAIKEFRYLYGNKKDFLEELNNDRIAIITDWNDYTDKLCKDGCITENQYNNWNNPFDNRGQYEMY